MIFNRDMSPIVLKILVQFKIIFCALYFLRRMFATRRRIFADQTFPDPAVHRHPHWTTVKRELGDGARVTRKEQTAQRAEEIKLPNKSAKKDHGYQN